MGAGDIFNGPNLFDLTLALMDPRGRSICFQYVDADGQPTEMRAFVNSVDNGCGDGRFTVRGFCCGSDLRYKAVYNPATGTGTMTTGQPF